MAKGDDARARNKIDEQSGLAGNRLNNLWDTVTPQNQTFWNNYKAGWDQSMSDRANLNSRFSNFADTGGFNTEDLSAIRARGLSPVRAAYASAQEGLKRNKRCPKVVWKLF